LCEHDCWPNCSLQLTEMTGPCYALHSLMKFFSSPLIYGQISIDLRGFVATDRDDWSRVLFGQGLRTDRDDWSQFIFGSVSDQVISAMHFKMAVLNSKANFMPAWTTMNLLSDRGRLSSLLSDRSRLSSNLVKSVSERTHSIWLNWLHKIKKIHQKNIKIFSTKYF